MPPTSSPIDPFVCRRDGALADAAWVHLAGELDVATAPQLERTLREALSDASLVVLDLRSVTFMDLSGVWVIVDASRAARSDQRDLNVLRGSTQVDRIFTLTGTAGDLNTVELSGAVR